METALKIQFEKLLANPDTDEATRRKVAFALDPQYWMVESAAKVQIWEDARTLVQFPYMLYFKAKSFGWITPDIDAEIVKLPKVSMTCEIVAELLLAKFRVAMRAVYDTGDRTDEMVKLEGRPRLRTVRAVGVSELERYQVQAHNLLEGNAC